MFTWFFLKYTMFILSQLSSYLEQILLFVPHFIQTKHKFLVMTYKVHTYFASADFFPVTSYCTLVYTQHREDSVQWDKA